jgi:predicted Zn-dependent protease with MMP-like domain
MKMDEFANVVRRVLDHLPVEIRRALRNVVVDVAEEPSVELLLESGFTQEEIVEGDTLFGLFEPLDFGFDTDGESPPERLWIFKNPHEEEFSDRKQLLTEIRKTVIHEVAHHFQWTDRDLAKFDETADPFKDNLLG